MARSRTTWHRGPSENPAGTGLKLKVPPEIRELAQGYAEESIRTLGRLMADPDQPAQIQLHAASLLLDRGFGRPKEYIEIEEKMDLVTLLAEIADRRRAVNGHDAPIALEAAKAPAET